MKMKRWTKGMLCLALCFALVISGTGCGKKTGSQDSEAAKQHVFRETVLELDLPLQDINSMFQAGGRIFVYGYVYPNSGGGIMPRAVYDLGAASGDIAVPETAAPDTDEGSSGETTETTESAGEESSAANETAAGEESPAADETAAGDEAPQADTDVPADAPADTTMPALPGGDDSYQVEFVMCSFKPDGSDIKSFSFNMDGSSSFYNLTGDSEGNVYGVLSRYIEDNSDPENIEYKNELMLKQWDMDGNEGWSKDLAEEGMEYVGGMFCDSQNRLLITADQKILVYNTDGTPNTSVDLGEGKYINQIFTKQDGTILVSGWGESQFIQKLDLNTKSLTDSYTLPGSSFNYNISPGYGYDVFLRDSQAVYGYNFGEENINEIFNYVDSDLTGDNLNNLIGISETEMIGTRYDEESMKTVLVKYTKVDPSEIKDKTIITLGCTYVDYNVKRRIVSFNKASDLYRVRLTDYSSYNTEEDWQAGVNKLNTDIVSGNVPDILVLNSQLPVNSYVAKGLFEDLYPFIDKDPDLERADYLPNILEAFSVDGKLYQLVPSFGIQTAVAKTSDVGPEPGWTLQDLKALMATKPEGTEAFPSTLRETILYYAVGMAGDQFIDWSTGKCTFNSDSFKQLLEFANEFPKEYTEDMYGDDYWQGYDTMFRDGRAVAQITGLYDFNTYNSLKKATFGEDITLIGFPSDNKQGSAISADLSFAISSKSKNKDGAWEFLRYYLTDEYQDSISYNWPISLKRLEAMGEEAMQKPYYEDENGNKIEYDNTAYINGVEIIIAPMTREEVDVVINFIKSLDQVMNYDQQLLNIINEESAAYFEGQKSVNEVADIIQSRVQIYINENR